MRQHRGHWNRGKWTRKSSPRDEADYSLLLKTSPPMRNAAKVELDPWKDIARAEDSRSNWDVQTCAESFYDDNRKIFEWDDSGAVEYLKKAEAKLQQGISSNYADFLNDSSQFKASIDWDTRWLCTLPDCTEKLEKQLVEEERRKYLKGISTRRDQSDSSSAVILGLPEPKDETGCSGTPSLHLPLDSMPPPTGWDEAEDNPRTAQRQDSSMQPVKAPILEDMQVEPSPQGWCHTGTNGNHVRTTGSGWPECPSSYQHIIPSGWEDVQVDQPVVASGWGPLDLEPRSDAQMHGADVTGCDYPSYSSRPAWGNPHPSAEPHPVNDKSQYEKQQDLCNKSQKYGWRPKRGIESNNLESSGRRNMPGPGKPISTIRRVNYDPRSRINRAERSKAQ